MRNKTNTFGVLCAVFLLGSCKKNPIDRLINPVPDGAVSQTSGIFVIYDDELKTGGGLGFIPGGENQVITQVDASSPRRSDNQIRYSWNGQDVSNSGSLQHLFAGFSLLVTPDFSTFDSASAKNLNANNAGYTKLTFYIRGTLASDTYVRIEGPDDGPGGITPARMESLPSLTGTFTLTEDWQKQELTVPAGDFNQVKSFLTLSIQYMQPVGTTVGGGGGTIYLDDIRYE